MAKQITVNAYDELGDTFSTMVDVNCKNIVMQKSPMGSPEWQLIIVYHNAPDHVFYFHTEQEAIEVKRRIIAEKESNSS